MGIGVPPLGRCGAALASMLFAATADAQFPAAPIEVGYCSRLQEVEAVKAAGFAYAELRTSEIAELSDADFVALAARLEQLALPVPVTFLFIPREIRVTGPEVDEALQMSYVRRALDRVSRLGATTVVFGSGPARSFPEGFPKAEAFRQLVGFCKRLGPEARARGITIAFEPQRRQESNLVNSVEEGLELVQAVGDPNIQLVVDFFHLAEEKEDPAVLLKAKPHVRHLHMANPRKRAFPLRWEEYDYAPFFARLAEISYRGRISVEAAAVDFAAEAPRTIAFLREALGFGPPRRPAAPSPQRFDFGPGRPAPGSTQVLAGTAYTLERTVLDLAKHLVDGLPVFDPAHPDPLESWGLPASPAVPIRR